VHQSIGREEETSLPSQTGEFTRLSLAETDASLGFPSPPLEGVSEVPLVGWIPVPALRGDPLWQHGISGGGVPYREGAGPRV